MNWTETKTRKLGIWIDVLQLATLVIGIASLAAMLGSRDATLTRATSDIENLSLITKDLASVSVANQTTAAIHAQLLEEIKRRIERLEQRTSSN